MFPTKQWMAIAVGGVVSALLYALVTYGSIGGVLLAYFCQLPLFIIGLSMGTTASVIAGSIAAAGVIAVSGVLGAFIFLLVNAAPVVLLQVRALLPALLVALPVGLLLVARGVERACAVLIAPDDP